MFFVDNNEKLKNIIITSILVINITRSLKTNKPSNYIIMSCFVRVVQFI